MAVTKDRAQANNNNNKTNPNPNNDTLVSHPQLILGPVHLTRSKHTSDPSAKSLPERVKTLRHHILPERARTLCFQSPPEGEKTVCTGIYCIYPRKFERPTSGRQTKHFIPQWERRGAHSFQIGILKLGYRLPFKNHLRLSRTRGHLKRLQ